MKKIVIDARMINVSGIGTYIKNFIPAIIDKNRLFLIGDRSELEEFSWFSSKEKIIQANFGIYTIGEQMLLPFLIPACDVFISPHFNVPMLPVNAKRRIVIIPDVYHISNAKTISLSHSVYAKLLVYMALKKSNTVITISHFSESEIVKYFPHFSNKLQVAYCGIDMSKFGVSVNQNHIETIKTKYNLPDNYILYVGNVKPHKNLLDLIYAFASLIQEIENLFLVITGRLEGFITSDVRALEFIENNERLKNKIVFTGYVKDDDLPVIYKLASVFVFPSKYEGFGLPPLEAMASGCPVISSDAASLPEICGEGALYFSPGNTDDLAKKVRLLLANGRERSKLIANGYENIKRFSWTNFNRVLQNAIDE